MFFAVGNHNLFFCYAKASFWLFEAIVDRMFSEIAKTYQRIRDDAHAQIGIDPMKHRFNVTAS